MSKFNELVDKLREIFQIDRPELDFGIYRILNSRAVEINDYLENRLKEKVEEVLATSSSANVEQLKEALQKAEQGAHELGVSPDTVPKVQELKKKIAETSVGAAEHENAVFSHLLTFFSRYYDQGDFLSQRRYKGDTYAIPYAGEEVMLHWANKDQYYIKSGENFSNYSFKLDDGRVVHFRLIIADTAKDNRKDSDTERRFILAAHKVSTLIDEEGDEYEDEILPVEEVTKKDEVGANINELVIRFEYKAMPKGTKQHELVEAAVADVLKNSRVAANWLDLAKREPTEKNPKRTLLEKHLTNYTAKNTSDYFIHKNLGRFLKEELDFYIKNEVMHLDDVQNAEAFSHIEKSLRMIQCLQSIALDLIAFMTQLEDFQKKLWTKKKFVVSSHYCITLDKVPQELYEIILHNDSQWAQWRKLGLWSSKKNGDLQDLKKHQYLPVDTSNFDGDFAYRLLKGIDDLDLQTTGILIQGDNYQALRLLQNKYLEGIDVVYIDPPYNTNASEILYKNGYKSSSWNSLIFDRVKCGHALLKNDGVQVFTIDDMELENGLAINNLIFDSSNHLATTPIRNNPQGRSTVSGFAVNHEYALFYRKSAECKTVGRLPRSEAQDNRYKEIDEKGMRYLWENFRKTGTDSAKNDRPKQFYPIWIDKDGVITAPKMEWNQKSSSWDVLDMRPKDTIEIWPIDSTGVERVWKWGIDRFLKEIDIIKFEVVKDRCEIYRKNYLNDEGKLPGTWWDDPGYSAGSHGTNVLSSMFGNERVFLFPKSYKAVIDCLRVSGLGKEGTALDYFAGSASTAHAIFAMNSEDDGSRKFILVEQGEYFNKVTKPRVLKSAYSQNWKNGKPVDSNGCSIIVKVLSIESYEDALNNLELKRTKQQQSFLDSDKTVKTDYQINYMLNVESQGSLLSIDDFKKPFDYAMKIAADSAGAFKEQNVDLVETFNYLVGLAVKNIDAQPERGFVTVTGSLPSGETCLVLWRDSEVLDYEGVSKLCDKLAINPKDNEFDVVYINGDHNIPTVLTQTAEEGGETRVLKLRQIEPEFLQRMFSSEDV